MTPPPRRVTPAPTLPPEVLEVAEKKIGWVRGIIAAGLAAAALGWTLHTVISGQATKEDLERARTSGAAELAPVAAEVRTLTTHQAVLESGLASLKDDIADLKKSAAEQRAWLIEIAKAVGARAVSSPATAP